MNGLVIYAEDLQGAQQIRERLERQRGYCFAIARIDSLSEVPEGITYVAVDWSARDTFCQLVRGRVPEYGIAFYDDRFYCDIDDTAEVDAAILEAVRNRDWRTCKGLNRFYLTGDIIRRRETLRGKPAKLQLETTDLCNARCIMCSHAYDRGTGIDLLQSGILERLEGVLPFLDVVVLHGNGEPFLKRDITDYLRIMTAYGIRFITNTNLSIVTEEILPYLRDSFVELNVSCDGHNAELYESIRPGLSFERFVRNARLVREHCPNLRMKMSVVVMRQNMAYMAELVDFASDLGFDEVVFNQLCVDERNHNLRDAAYLYPEELSKYTRLAIERGAARGIAVIAPDPEGEGRGDSEERTDATSGTNTGISCCGVCDWVVESPYIDLRGNVAPCCMSQNLYLGNLFTESFDAIWNGAHYRQMRAQFAAGRLPATCRGCDFLNQGRLRYLSTKETGRRMMQKDERVRPGSIRYGQ